MVSTEYPPMKGGVGRYTSNLAKALRELGLRIYIVCNESGKGDFYGLSPTNVQNSQILLKIVKEINPDIVHIQLEPGMYGLLIDPLNPANSGTYIDSFYLKCKIPIVTTFHTGYNFKQWMNPASLIKKTGRTGIYGVPLRFAIRFWKNFLNYKVFKNLNKQKFGLSHGGIVFSRYMLNNVGGGKIIYHGAQPVIGTMPKKEEIRSLFSLPPDSKIALALGFRTITKGWDMIAKMDIPYGWKVVINSSKGHYNAEKYDLNLISNANSSYGNNNVINLQRGFLEERDLSLLLYASDAVILPYKVTSGSGVMFDALGHGIPFVASDIGFFKEFAAQGVGVAVQRSPRAFSVGIKKLEKNYSYYVRNVDTFRKNLRWDLVAIQHNLLYSSIVNEKNNNNTKITM